MIEDKENANKISELSVKLGEELNDSLIEMSEKLSVEEMRKYKLAVGKVMGAILIEIMNPIYNNHPDLKPKGLK